MSFWHTVGKSFWSVQTGIVGLISVVLSFVLAKSAASTASMSVILLAALVVVIVLILSTLIRSTYIAVRAATPALPRVIAAQSTPAGHGTALLVLGASVLFSQDIGVSIYYRSDEFELIVGLGVVEAIREDKRIQVALTHPIPGHEDVIDRLTKNDSAVLKKLVIKPSVPRAYVHLIAGSK